MTLKTAGSTHFASVSAFLLTLGGVFVVLGFVPQTLVRSLSFVPPSQLTIQEWRVAAHSQGPFTTREDPVVGEQEETDRQKRISLQADATISQQCNSEDCALLVRGAGDAAIIKIDGVVVSETGVFPRVISREDHFPIMASIPRSTRTLQPLTINVDVYCKHDCGAIAGGLTASLVKKEDALSYVRANTVKFAFLPVASSMGLLCIALITGVFLLTGQQQLWFGVVLVVHCVANGIAYFLFADVLYETLPMRYATPLYLSLRNIGNLAFFALSLIALKFGGSARKLGYMGFALASIGTCMFVGVAGYVACSSEDILSAVGKIDVAGSYFGPLKFAALVTCLVGCLLSIRNRRYLLPALIFAFLLGITAFDEVVIFGYPYRSYVGKFHALVVGSVFLGIFLRRRTELSTERRMQVKSDAEIAHLARQVAHDIRSPLAALKMVSQEEGCVSEEIHDIVEMAVGRLTGIADTLLEAGRSSSLVIGKDVTSNAQDSDGSLFAVAPVAAALVAQKRIEFVAHTSLALHWVEEPEAKRAHIAVNCLELQRALSNLINNAAEAMKHTGPVSVRLTADGRTVSVTVADKGCGIPSHVLAMLGERGVTHAKTGGNGLGVAHAKQFAESCGGTFAIESTENVGTCVTLRLPQSLTPEWFVASLDLYRGQKIVVVDDDQTIHKMWQKRFHKSGAIQHVVLAYVDTMDKVTEAAASADLCLVDYHLDGFGMNGIELIEKIGVLSRAILTTSAAEEPSIQNRCSKLGLRLLPKQQAGRIDINVLSA